MVPGPTAPPFMLRSLPYLLTAALCLGPSAPIAAAGESPEAPWEWSQVSRVVAIGDLHGSYEKLVRLLEAASLLGDRGQWIGGSDHLVVIGDFLDRGSEERKLMDLLRRLEAESVASGGYVHVLLGNHEVMNLLRETRYVARASYRAFVEEETESQRIAALRQYSPDGIDPRRPGDLTAFNRHFPKGFFARQRAFDPDGEYGSWLLTLPAVVKINDVVYVHGGMNPEFASLGIAGINRTTTGELERHLAARQELERLGVVTPVMGLSKIVEVAEKSLERTHGKRLHETQVAARELIASNDAPILGSRGPLWYRGNSFEDERIERADIERSLDSLGAQALVIAHSPTSGDRITSRFHGQVFRVDHGIQRSEDPLALVAERGEMMVLDTATGEMSAPVRELPVGGPRAWSGSLSDEQEREFLRHARVVETRELGSGRTRPQVVVMERKGERRRGLFKTVEVSPAGSDPDRYQHEVAAYLLDRQLDLGMVPVTVTRKIDGDEGSLQSWVENAVDLETASAYGLEMNGAERAARQLARGEVFDALIGNTDRKPADEVLVLDGSDRIFLIDHSRAFSLSWDLQWDHHASPIGPGFAAALRDLDRESLVRDLQDLLSMAQIDALLERRDRLLEQVVVAEAESYDEASEGRSFTAVP